MDYSKYQVNCDDKCVCNSASATAHICANHIEHILRTEDLTLPNFVQFYNREIHLANHAGKLADDFLERYKKTTLPYLLGNKFEIFMYVIYQHALKFDKMCCKKH